MRPGEHTCANMSAGVDTVWIDMLCVQLVYLFKFMWAVPLSDYNEEFLDLLYDFSVIAIKDWSKHGSQWSEDLFDDDTQQWFALALYWQAIFGDTYVECW